jgi:VanZ like protein
LAHGSGQKRGLQANPREERALGQRSSRRATVVLILKYWLPVMAYMGLVQFLGAQPDLQVLMLFPNADKVVHVMEYGILGALLARAFRATLGVAVPIQTSLVAVSVGLTVGATDELVQAFVPNRMSSLNDLLADGTGLLIAQFIFLLVVRE